MSNIETIEEVLAGVYQAGWVAAGETPNLGAESLSPEQALQSIQKIIERDVLGKPKRVAPITELKDQRDLIENHHKVIATNEQLYKQKQALTNALYGGKK